MRKGEAALEALKVLLAPVADDISGGSVVRNPESELPADETERWVLSIRDGDTGEPEVSLSPPAYEYEHEAALALTVVKIGAADADTLFSSIVEKIGELLDADPTIGGAVDWAQLGTLNTDEVDQEVMAGFKAAIIPVRLLYTTTSPQG